MKRMILIALGLLTFTTISANASEFCVSIKEPGAYGTEGYRKVYCKDNSSVATAVGIKRLERKMQEKGYEIQSRFYNETVLVFQSRNSRGLYENKETCVVAEYVKIPHLFTNKGTPAGYEINCGDDNPQQILRGDKSVLLKFAQKNNLKEVHRVEGRVGWYRGVLTAPYTVRHILIYQNR